VSPTLIAEHEGTVAFLSHVRRDGAWMLPRSFRAVAFLGNVELDLTSVCIGAGVSDVEVRSVLGSITILAPPDLRIECRGDPLAGSFEVVREAESTASLDAPVVRITGMAILGTVEVKIVDPNAPKWYEKLAARLATRPR
jgi:hypothetical protein